MTYPHPDAATALAQACNTTTSAAALTELACHPSRVVRVAVATHPNTPSDVLATLWTEATVAAVLAAAAAPEHDTAAAVYRVVVEYPSARPGAILRGIAPVARASRSTRSSGRRASPPRGA